MSDPFSAFLCRLQRVHGMFLELHTAVLGLRSFIDDGIASDGSGGEEEAVAHARLELARITAAFHGLASAAWKIGFDMHNLKVALDICTNFPTPTHSQVAAHDSVFGTLHRHMLAVALVYRRIRDDVADIPVMIALKVPLATELADVLGA